RPTSRTFFAAAPSPPATYTLSLHDALPIYDARPRRGGAREGPPALRRSRPLGLRGGGRLPRALPGGAAPRRGADPRRRPRKSHPDRKSTRLNSSHVKISYAVFCLKKKKNQA